MKLAATTVLIMAILWIATGYQFFRGSAWFVNWDPPIRFGYHIATVLAAILAGMGLTTRKTIPTGLLFLSQAMCWSYVGIPLLIVVFVGVTILSIDF